MKKLLKKLSVLKKQIAHIGPFIEGYVCTYNKTCGKPTCKCMSSIHRHKVLRLTWKENKKTVSLYVPVSKHTEVIEWSKNYKKLKKLIKRSSDLQKKSLKLS